MVRLRVRFYPAIKKGSMAWNNCGRQGNGLGHQRWTQLQKQLALARMLTSSDKTFRLAACYIFIDTA